MGAGRIEQNGAALRVFVVDDQEVVRRGVRDLVNAAGGFPGQTAVLQQWDCSSVDQWNAWNQLWTFKIATSQLPPIH